MQKTTDHRLRGLTAAILALALLSPEIPAGAEDRERPAAEFAASTRDTAAHTTPTHTTPTFNSPIDYDSFTLVVPGEGETLASLAAAHGGDTTRTSHIAALNGLVRETTKVEPDAPLIIPKKESPRGGLYPGHYQLVPVLGYHNFTRGKSKNSMTVTADNFERQMRYLKKAGYTVITMDALFDFLDFKKGLPEKSVVITIDDGWESVYTIAWPILKRYGYPATLFVYTELIRKKSTDKGKGLSWDQIRAMADEGMAIEGHTKSHRLLNRMKPEEDLGPFIASINEELTASAEKIKKEVGRDIKYMAYPYGQWSKLTVALIKKHGYRGAFTTLRGSTPFFANNYLVNRNLIFGEHSFEYYLKNLGYRGTAAVTEDAATAPEAAAALPVEAETNKINRAKSRSDKLKTEIGKATETEASSIEALAEKFLLLARAYEEAGELPMALESLRVAASLDPGDTDSLRHMTDLIEALRTSSDRHLKTGLEYLNLAEDVNSKKRARREFLLALGDDPDSGDALYMAKTAVIGETHTTYRTGESETVKDVARAAYGDEEMWPLVADFNNLSAGPLTPGRVISLPLWDTNEPDGTLAAAKERAEITKKLTLAGTLFKESRFEEVAEISSLILSAEPDNDEAREMKNYSYFIIGTFLADKADYSAALDNFKNVDPGFRGVDASIGHVKKSISKIADSHYWKGIDLFVKDDLKEAIAQWESALFLNPEHSKAKMRIKNARSLIGRTDNF